MNKWIIYDIQSMKQIYFLYIFKFMKRKYAKYLLGVKWKTCFPNTQNVLCRIRRLNFVVFLASTWFNFSKKETRMKCECSFSIVFPLYQHTHTFSLTYSTKFIALRWLGTLSFINSVNGCVTTENNQGKWL